MRKLFSNTLPRTVNYFKQYLGSSVYFIYDKTVRTWIWTQYWLHLCGILYLSLKHFHTPVITRKVYQNKYTIWMYTWKSMYNKLLCSALICVDLVAHLNYEIKCHWILISHNLFIKNNIHPSYSKYISENKIHIYYPLEINV